MSHSTVAGSSAHGAKRLGWFLVFAIVYADIGTSIFYVPGILYLSIGNLATLAQVITTGVFVSIALKYVEICERCPDGGGVVSIVRQAFSRWEYLPVAGGAFITVDYFLTSAISGVSGLFYLASLFPGAKAWVVPASVLLFLFLAVLNVVGIRESAGFTSLFAVGKLVVSFLLLGAASLAITRLPGLSWQGLVQSVLHPGVPLTVTALAIGYADTWLAYSGLESAAQVSGAMRSPVRATASKALWWVIGTIAILSPPITAAALYILPESVKRGDPESLLSSLAFTVGGPVLGVLTVLAASALLFMACNTAIVGNYHVNVRLADLGFLPGFLRRLHPRLRTPFISIAVSAAVPLAVILATRGSVTALGDLYAFGLLGTLVLSSVAVDRLRWRDGKRGLSFWSGVMTSGALVAAWLINMVHKPHALLFGGTLSLALVLVSIWHRRHAVKEAAPAFAEAEARASEAPEAARVLTLDEAVELRPMEESPALISLRYNNRRLIETAALYLKGQGETNAYVVYVDESPGLYVPLDVKPSPEARTVLDEACRELGRHGITGLPVWRFAEDAGESVSQAAVRLDVKTVFVGASKRSFFWRLLRGRVLKRLAQSLPESCQLIVAG